MVKIKKRFCALFEDDNAGKIYSQLGRIKRELKLFYTEEKREWAEPMLKSIERNSKDLFLYEKLPEKKIIIPTIQLRLYLASLGSNTKERVSNP